MSDRWAQAEGERIQANMIRVGRVIEVDAANALAKMLVGGLSTDWLPWAVSRAGGTRTASAPTVGEQRLVFSPYGDTTQAIIGPALYQDDHPAPTASETVETIVFSDGASAVYDTASHAMTVTVPAGGSVTVDAPEVTFTGNVTVQGDATFTGPSVTHGGKDIGKTHTHSGVQTGSGTSGPPV